MSALGSANPERSHRQHRTIRATFLVTVLVPVASMLVLWGLLVAEMLVSSGSAGRGHSDLAGIYWVAGTALVIILISVALMGLFARRIAADIGGLEVTAAHLANEELPQLVERLRRGEPVRAGAALPVTRAVTAEVAQAEAAIASLASAAAAAAAAEASLRRGIGQVFVSLARRNQSLLQRQLRLIDALEQKASDPDTLADLFPLDHLTTRMRRHAEGLIILAGAAPGRSWSQPVPVIDVIRGAAAEIEDYQRVSVLTRARDAVAGHAVADVIHLLAELIENATLFSPAGTRVEVRAERVANGFAVEVDDHGLGFEARQLATVNAQLATPPDFDLANADQLGLFVVGKLAARHGIRVKLRPARDGGTTAWVLMPDNIVVPPNVTGGIAQPDRWQTADRGRTGGLPPPAGTAAGPQPPAPPILAAPGPARPSAAPRPAAAPHPAEPAATPHPAEPAVAGAAGPVVAGAAGPDATAAGAHGPAASGPQPGAGSYRGLPRRVRQASLNPHLRQPRPAPDRAPSPGRPAPADDRSPEEARRLVSSLQRGWQRGREAEPAASQATGSTDAQATDERAARPDADVPRAGEA